MTTEAIRIAKEALELTEKATPGPWRLDHDWTLEVIDRDEHNVAKLPHHMASTPSNAAFIAFARTALPVLARAVLESHIVEQERDAWLRLEMAAVEHVQDIGLHEGHELVEALAEVERVRQDRGEVSRSAEQERADVRGPKGVT